MYRTVGFHARDMIGLKDATGCAEASGSGQYLSVQVKMMAGAEQLQ